MVQTFTSTSSSMPVLSRPPPRIRARQIDESDFVGIVKLLAKGFPARGRRFWVRVLALLSEHSTPAGVPKYGYLLESDGTPVGVLLLIFSTRRMGAIARTRCNVSSWYVEPAFRSYATAIVSQAVKLKDVTYINISAAPHTRETVELKGFSRYSDGIFVSIPALNSRPGGIQVEVLAGPACPNADLEACERELLLDHAAYGCLTLCCVTADRAYPFVFRPRAIRGIAICAQLIYCRDLEDFVRFAGPIGRYLALRGNPLVIVDSNGSIPGLLGKYLHGRMPKYFKGPDGPRLGDLAYTEAAMFGV
jgi:hypothetical protein